MYTDATVGTNLPAHRYRLQPFWGWTADVAPTWWTANNRIKHPKGKDASRYGNLRHATHAVASLFILLRWATQHQRGSGTFHQAGNPWRLRDPGTEHIEWLFDPGTVDSVNDQGDGTPRQPAEGMSDER